MNVLQANLRLGSADAPHLVEELRDHHIDVLTTEELSPEEVARLDGAGIAAVLPYRYRESARGRRWHRHLQPLPAERWALQQR